MLSHPVTTRRDLRLPEKRQLVAEDILRLRLVGDVQIAPGGGLVVFVERWQDEKENKTRSRVRGVRRALEPFDLTSGDGDGSPRISPDGSRIAFLRKGKDAPQIFILPLSGGEAWQLTDIEGGVANPIWSPDGHEIAFTANLNGKGIQPEGTDKPADDDYSTKYNKDVKVITELAHKMDGEGYFTDRRACLCTVRAEAGEKPLQLTEPPYMVHAFCYSADGRSILFSSRRDEDYDRKLWDARIYEIPAGGGDVRHIPTEGIAAYLPVAGADGAVYFVGSRPEEMGYDNSALYRAEEGGPRPVTPHYDRPIGNETVNDLPAPSSAQLVWSSDRSGLYALSSQDGTVQLVRIGLDGRVENLTEGRHVVYDYAATEDGAEFVLAISDPMNPGDLYRFDPKTRSLERLTAVNQAFIDEVEMEAPDFFQATSPDGTKVDTWVIRPGRLAEGAKAPTVLMIHGGPMTMFSHTLFFEYHLMAAKGMGVVFTNPRGSSGYGYAHCAAIQFEWGNLDLMDMYAGLDQAIARHPWIDADRLGVGGGSYGGYMTNWIIGHTDRFKAAVSGRSVVDWRAMFGTGDGGWEWTRRAKGVPFWQDDSWYAQQSPITYVENIRTPLLIENQEGDLRCPIEQGMMLYTAVKWLGKAPVRFVRYPDEFHGMNRGGKPWHRVHRLREIIDWYQKYLGIAE